MTKVNVIQSALNNIGKNHSDILRAERIGGITFVILNDGSAGVAYRKKGDVDKPYLACELAYVRAKEEQIMNKL